MSSPHARSARDPQDNGVAANQPIAAHSDDDDRIALEKLGFRIPGNGNLSAQWKAFLKEQARAGDAPSAKE